MVWSGLLFSRRRNIERFVSGVTGPAGMDDAFVALANPDGPGVYETLKMQVRVWLRVLGFGARCVICVLFCFLSLARLSVRIDSVPSLPRFDLANVVCHFVGQVLSLLLNVMQFEEVDPFLVQLTQGRYGRLACLLTSCLACPGVDCCSNR
jgi:hypothetical protein